MITFLTSVFWLIVALMILVIVHELGHFLTAKYFKMKVDRFSVGFPPNIFKKQVGETEYVVGLTPLGGYVNIAGMVDESMNTDNLESAPEPWEFRAKPVWQRIIVITGGVIFNIILAWLIFSTLNITHGKAYIPADKIPAWVVEPNSPAYTMGIRNGDKIIAVNGKKVEKINDVVANSSILTADQISFTVNRNGKQETFIAPEGFISQVSKAEGLGISPDFVPTIGEVVEGSPAAKAGVKANEKIIALNDKPVKTWNDLTMFMKQSKGEKITFKTTAQSYQITPNKSGERYVLGVAVAQPTIKVEQFGFFAALGQGWSDTWAQTAGLVNMLKKIFSGRESAKDSLGGPIMIAKQAKKAADNGGAAFWAMVAMLSVSLAVMNILPIPALDGGHLVFLIYEGITRKEPSLKVRMIAQQVGMAIMLLLFVFIFYNDISKLF